MVGAIRGWDVLTHPIATIRCFGWRVFFRAVAPWQSRTFLSIVSSGSFSPPATPAVAAVLDRCIDLEMRAKRIYSAMAKALEDHGLLGPFFGGMAVQEQYHADLLGLCRAAAVRHGWRANIFGPWQDYLPEVERKMDAAEAELRNVDSDDAALRLVVQIETSQINALFTAALLSADAPFVKRLKPFRQAVEAHIAYVVERVPQLSPHLLVITRELRARFPRVPTNEQGP
jgi:hypothetical protein